jgi:peptidoglycan/LPS O-acetylase OafA/YrhL
VERDIRLDILKMFSIVSVILIHTFTEIQKMEIFAYFNIIQAVPIFLIITGYNLTNSYQNKGICNLRECYSYKNIYHRLSGIIIPFIIIFIIEMLIATRYKLYGFSITNIFKLFIEGGNGPGSYYIPLIIEVMLIFPLLYRLALKSTKKLLAVTFTVNLLFELFAYYINMPNSIYSVNLLRYIFLIAIGINIVLGKSEKSLVIVIGIISSIYIYAVHYLGIRFTTQSSWGSQNIFSFFYTALIFIILMKYLPRKINSKIIEKLTIIGQASFSIFLVQKVYFWYIKQIIGVSTFTNLEVLKNLSVCILLGITFHYIIKYTKIFIKKIEW